MPHQFWNQRQPVSTGEFTENARKGRQGGGGGGGGKRGGREGGRGGGCEYKTRRKSMNVKV